MSKETENFLRVEQSAQELLKTIEELKNETVSYKTSTMELDVVRVKLSGLIDSIQAVARDTHAVVALLKAIGGPEILSQISILSDKLNRLRTLAILGASVGALSLVGVVVLLLR